MSTDRHKTFKNLLGRETDMSRKTKCKTKAVVSIICPACAKKRLHTKAETKQYHPLAGHGYIDVDGPTHPLIEDRRKPT